MSSQVFTLVAWAFLPNLVTGWTQSFWYRLSTRAGDPMPQPGTSKFNRDRRNIFVLVIVSYLLYTIYEMDWSLRQQSDFYADLGLPFNAEDRAIQSRFRKLTLHIHPDKLKNPSAGQLAAAQNYYIHLKTARDTLVDASRKFGYERFGPDALQWSKCVTRLDFVKHGLQQLVPYYIVSFCSLIVAGFLGYSEHTKFWQYFVVVSLFIFEAHTVTRPGYPVLVVKVVNPLLKAFTGRQGYLPYQAISMIRRIAVSMFVAAAQIAPQFQDPRATPDSPEAQQQVLRQLAIINGELDGDAQRMLNLETAPFFAEEALSSRLKSSLTSWLIQNEVRNEAGVQSAIRKVVARKNEEQTT